MKVYVNSLFLLSVVNQILGWLMLIMAMTGIAPHEHEMSDKCSIPFVYYILTLFSNRFFWVFPNLFWHFNKINFSNLIPCECGNWFYIAGRSDALAQCHSVSSCSNVIIVVYEMVFSTQNQKTIWMRFICTLYTWQQLSNVHPFHRRLTYIHPIEEEKKRSNLIMFGIHNWVERF